MPAQVYFLHVYGLHAYTYYASYTYTCMCVVVLQHTHVVTCYIRASVTHPGRIPFLMGCCSVITMHHTTNNDKSYVMTTTPKRTLKACIVIYVCTCTTDLCFTKTTCNPCTLCTVPLYTVILCI